MGNEEWNVKIYDAEMRKNSSHSINPVSGNFAAKRRFENCRSSDGFIQNLKSLAISG
jgi:hypothetical protein